jgi:hypothetical protein
MPKLKNILANTPSETKKQQELRANTIQAIGEILESVSSQPEVCNADAREVLQALTEMMSSGKLDESDP